MWGFRKDQYRQNQANGYTKTQNHEEVFMLHMYSTVQMNVNYSFFCKTLSTLTWINVNKAIVSNIAHAPYTSMVQYQVQSLKFRIFIEFFKSSFISFVIEIRYTFQINSQISTSVPYNELQLTTFSSTVFGIGSSNGSQLFLGCSMKKELWIKYFDHDLSVTSSLRKWFHFSKIWNIFSFKFLKTGVSKCAWTKPC